MKLIYFSPTGSTEKVVKLIGSVWGKENIEIDLSVFDNDYEKCQCEKDEIIIVGVPSFGGRVPVIALENLKKIHGNYTKAIIVVTYGNRAYDDTLLELKNCLKENNFNVIAAIASVTEHSIMHQFATGRPTNSDVKELITFAKKIKEKIDTDQEIEEVSVNGKVPYREYNGVPLKPKTNKKCKECGICAKLCPVNAIPLNNPKDTDTTKCITCMRCIKICPNKSRNLNPFMSFIAGNKMKRVCSVRKENELFIK